ncbi:MAG: ABC transporter, partial [Defluviitaleaceae bacterium]|nr:ABC transporter [Defluviitaleaceae bacterium]
KLNEEKGTTVLLTTHDMQDIEALTERIILIGRGQILLDGSLTDLKNRAPKGANAEEMVAALYKEYRV